MFKECIRIHGIITVCFPGDEEGQAIDIAPSFAKACPHGAEHIKKFAESNNLDITVNRGMCALCGGDSRCVAGVGGEHDVA